MTRKRDGRGQGRNQACVGKGGPAGVGEDGAGVCVEALAWYHDAVSRAVTWVPEERRFRVTNASLPLWAESKCAQVPPHPACLPHAACPAPARPHLIPCHSGVASMAAGAPRPGSRPCCSS
jgi:hypothetical protein